MSTAVLLPVSASAFAPAPADDEPLCIICQDEATAEKPFLNPGPCNCTGTIRYHRECVLLAMQYSTTCGACKKSYGNPNYLGATKRQLDTSSAEDMIGLDVPYLSRLYYNGIFELVYYNDAGERDGVSCVYGEYPWVNMLSFEVIAIRHFKNGQLDGDFSTYDVSNKRPNNDQSLCTPPVTAQLASYTYKGDKRVGPFKTYKFRYGIVETEGTYNESQKLVGRFQSYNHFNNVVRDVIYMDDGSERFADGEHTFGRWYVHDNHGFHGILKVPYKNGLRNGEARLTEMRHSGRYDPTPTREILVEVRNYKDGLRYGPITRYQTLGDDSQVAMTGNYKDGQRHGRFMLYHNSGRPYLELNFRNGLQVGRQTVWSFDACDRVDPVFDPFGVKRSYTRKIQTTTLAADGSCELDGPAVYYRAGKVFQMCNWRMGQLHGPFKLFDERGVKRWEIMMAAGYVKEGSLIRYFDEAGMEESWRAAGDDLYLGNVVGNIPLHHVYDTQNGYNNLIELFEPVYVEAEEDEDCCGCGCCRFEGSDDEDYEEDDDDAYDRWRARYDDERRRYGF